MANNNVLAVSFDSSDELMRFVAELRLAGGFEAILKKTRVDIVIGRTVMFCQLGWAELDDNRHAVQRIVALADTANHGVAYVEVYAGGDTEFHLNTLNHMHLHDMFYVNREVVSRASGPLLTDFKFHTDKGE
jgi:hypothetical protein